MIIRVLYIGQHFKHFVFHQNNKFQEMTLKQVTAYRQIQENIVML